MCELLNNLSFKLGTILSISHLVTISEEDIEIGELDIVINKY